MLFSKVEKTLASLIFSCISALPLAATISIYTHKFGPYEDILESYVLNFKIFGVILFILLAIGIWKILTWVDKKATKYLLRKLEEDIESYLQKEQIS